MIPDNRIFGLRLFDIILSIIVLWIIFSSYSYFAAKKSVKYSLAIGVCLALIVTFPLAITIHTIFQTPTALTCKLGLVNEEKCSKLFEKISSNKIKKHVLINNVI